MPSSLQCLVIIAVTILASEILASRSTNLAFITLPIHKHKQIKQRHNSIKTTLQQSTKKTYSADLDTAYEFLAKDRLEWFDPTDTNYIKTDADISSYEVKRMPLYPLGAVHVPYSGENHTLINIEPKNVKMAMVSLYSYEFVYFLSISLLPNYDTL